MKVFTAQQMRDFDKKAVEEYGIPTIVLMENAALRVVEFLEAKFSPLREKKIVILCGKGNNGGDGLAIARHLVSLHCEPTVFLMCSGDELKGDALLNYRAFQKGCGFSAPYSLSHFIEVNSEHYPKNDQGLMSDRGLMRHCFDADILIDALAGTSFKGEVRDERLRYALGMLNTYVSGQTKISVDLLSGINADNGIGLERKTFADFTVTFAAPKRGLFLRDGVQHSGEIWVGDIGATYGQTRQTYTDVYILNLEGAQSVIPQRQTDAHKGDAGRALIIGGSFGMSGAVALAAKAALNSGCGLCIAAIPEKILPIFAASILEATSHPLPCDESGKLLEIAADSLPELWKGVQVVALGPGIGRSDETQKLVSRIVRECPIPLVIDADALHALPAIAEEVKNREAETILTPHPGEMGVLMGISASEVHESRFETVEACENKYGAIVVLKGARTLVATLDGQIFVNLTGNSGMATGGSGDVLTGTIAGLLAQLKDAEDATKLGVYLHGFAGDLAFEEKGNGLVAGDIAANLGRALVEIPQLEVERINGRLRRLM
ncbi:MAG TPA: NAD(P)H-hydrate dehydratase [Abditibacterium sp.]